MRSHVSGNTVFNSLLDKYPDIRFELYPTEKTKKVYLTGFIVPFTMRGTGVGTAFMEDLVKLADQDGWTITLTPSSSYGGNVNRLKDFYKRFGFVFNKGSNRDFSHKEDMYRSPKNLNEGIEMLNEYIRKRGDKWVVISKKGKTLGTHDSHESALRQLRAIEAHKHMGEARSSDYLSWKRKNVTIRGVREVGEENDAGAMLGRGLYTAFLSNKELARKYGKVYFVLGAIPKNPKVFNTLNDWEIWFYNTLVYKYSKEKGNEYPDKRDFYANTTIEDEMQKLGYDGIVIKGREMVNFKPEDNIKYFSTDDELENYYNIVVNKPLEENDSLLNEKLADVDDDVDMLYDMYFRESVDEVKRTGIINAKVFKQLETDTSILKNEKCIKAHEINPCKLLVNKSSNHYDPVNSIISIGISLNAANYIISNFMGDIQKAIAYQDEDQRSSLSREFTEERIKGSIHHELAHWLDDTFNNQHIKKRIDKNLAGEVLPYNTVTVNAHYMEIQGQIHNIKQLHNKYKDIWDDLTFEGMINLSPPLTHVYKTLPYTNKVNWVKNLKLRMFREGLLGKKMFN